MKEKIACYLAKYKSNPGWFWLLATIFFFPILPEYISPFILFAGFIVFKRQWTREGRKAKTGTLGKLMMIFLGLSLVSTLWSDTMFSTFATASLWWGMFLVQVMIYNLAKTRKRIDTILKTMTLSGAINSAMGILQISTYTLARYNYIPKSLVMVTPFYKPLDKVVYEALPFAISTKTFVDRASGFFSNPNLLATYLLIVYPISIYLFINTKKKEGKICYFLMNILISGGISSTLTRAGCLVAIAGWVIMFIILFKRNWKTLLEIFVPTICIIIPSLLTRYGIIFKSGVVTAGGVGAVEAKKSSSAHFDIWKSLIDYIIHHAKAFIIGTGFGLEQTGIILKSMYDLNKPHAHNFVIETWVELGVIGLVIFMAVVICAFGKLLEINANNGRKFTLVFCVFTALFSYLFYGLTDYIFNSPKQIVLLFALLGLTQAISKCYDKTIIHDAKSLMQVAQIEVENSMKK